HEPPPPSNAAALSFDADHFGHAPHDLTAKRRVLLGVWRRHRLFSPALQRAGELALGDAVFGRAHDCSFASDVARSRARRSSSSLRPRTRRDCAAAMETSVIAAISASSWPRTSWRKTASAFRASMAAR